MGGGRHRESNLVNTLLIQLIDGRVGTGTRVVTILVRVSDWTRCNPSLMQCAVPIIYARQLSYVD